VVARLRALFRKKEFSAEAVDLNEAAHEVIALSLQELQRHRIAVQSEFEEDLPIVTGDRVQLQQVILNLLLNASDATKNIDDRPRRIFVRTACDDEGGARVMVRDTGVGVTSNRLGKLFGPSLDGNVGRSPRQYGTSPG
jgi:C4-dicarboxylate-specific signal transduction histidine kinase